MQTILIYFWRLCLLRESPERIPANLNLAITATLLYFLVSMVSFAVSRDGLSSTTIVGTSLVSFTVEALGLFGLLFFKGYRNRYLPTLIAIFCCNTLFSIGLLPVNYLLGSLDRGLTSDIINTLSLITLFWWLAIIGYILHKAAEISVFQGVVLAFVIELLVAVTIRSTFTEFS